MPLKIRCPHCRSVLVVEDQAAGLDRPCPRCGETFNVPVPISERSVTGGQPAAEVAAKCPKCGAPIAPGTPFCKKCFRDVRTGKRIPLGRRLRHLSSVSVVVLILIVVGLPVTVVVGYNIYRDRFAERDTPLPVFRPTPPAELPSAEWARALLAARSAAGRAAALHDLNQAGPRAIDDLAAALQEPPPLGVSAGEHRLNRRTALRFLGTHGDEHTAKFIAEATWAPELRDQTLLARGRLGDEAVLGELAAQWANALRADAFLSAAMAAGGGQSGPAAAAALRRSQERLKDLGDALRRFGRAGFEQAAPCYWESWSWLGPPGRDDAAEALYELAKPPVAGTTSIGEVVEDIRAARDLMEAVAADGPPPVRPVAAVLLVKFSPQYRSTVGRVTTSLAETLRDATPIEQQRLTWALARVTGRRFGAIDEDASPMMVCKADVVSALQWIRESRLAQPAPLRTHEGSYPGPPALARRIVPVARQAERDLLGELTATWSAAREAIDRWLAFGVGCTPRLRQLLDPAQRSPNYPALAAAMTLAAEYNETSWRGQLTIWREARDQPAWVRSLAFTALAALDARNREPIGRWPEGLELPPAGQRDGPSREDFARVIATGGEALVDRLAENRPLTLGEAEHARLVEAARAALGRRTARTP
jgi:predicted Zn finger-like uncharacterized protein